MPRFSLQTKFALVAGTTFVVLWFLLSRTLGAVVTDQVYSGARNAAGAVVKLGVAPNIELVDITKQIGAARVRELGKEMPADYAFEIVSLDGKIHYSHHPDLIGTRMEQSRVFSDAAAGDISSRVHPHGDAPVFEVFVPITQHNAHALVVFERPYAPIAGAVRSATLKVNLILFAALAVMFGLIFLLVRRTSNKLRVQADANTEQALSDPLTGLPSRALFADRVQQALAAAARSGSHVAVMLMDLDRFKEINDTLGHHHGDLLLKEIGPRVKVILREADTIARLGGDEFGILLASLPDTPAALGIAQKIRNAVHEPMTVQGIKLHVDTSIGVAMSPDHGDDTETLMQRADVAMYQAKEGGTGAEIYAAHRDQYTPGRLELAGELRYAIDDEELSVHYQPKVHLRTGHVKGLEALVRWEHPDKGMMAPGDFVPLAENTGLMESMTLHVLNVALGHLAGWLADGMELQVAVNLSVRNLLDPKLPEQVAGFLRKWDVPARWLELEITESGIMSDPVRARETLSRLNSMGVALAIDDYGTGHSSLSYIKRLPMTTLKIDKSFVLNMAEDENDLVIVRSTIDLAHNLGLEVVAEGVETEEVWTQLRLLGCDLAQGYYRGRPVRAKDVPWALRAIETAIRH